MVVLLIRITQPPFEPTESEAQAIINIGFMFADIIIFFFLICLMLYLFNRLSSYKDFLPILIIYLFSLIIGIEGLGHIHTHFSPNLEISFLMFQTFMFLLTSFKVYSNYKGI